MFGISGMSSTWPIQLKWMKYEYRREYCALLLLILNSLNKATWMKRKALIFVMWMGDFPVFYTKNCSSIANSNIYKALWGTKLEHQQLTLECCILDAYNDTLFVDSCIPCEVEILKRSARMSWIHLLYFINSDSDKHSVLFVRPQKRYSSAWIKYV